MPYLFGTALQAHHMGVPVMRAMPLEFPADPGCDTLDRQYMLGDSLLVAPVFTPSGWVDYYLPAGRWTNILNGKVVEGGRWVREQHDFFSLPLMARQNSIIPMGAQDSRPDYDFADGVSLHLFELQDGAAATVNVPTISGDEGMQVQASRRGQTIDVHVGGTSRPWSVVLRGVGQVQSVEGGAASPDRLGTRVAAAERASSMKIVLLEA
jgi:alpha-D-xyloside xylohydrolase